MGHFRFRKSVKIAPGVKLNFNKNSTSVTFGGKGAHYTVNSKGTRTASLGIPGTGISYVDIQNPNKNTPNHQSHTYQTIQNSNENQYNYVDNSNQYYNSDNQSPDFKNKQKPPIYQRNWFIILMMIFVSPIGIFLMWYFKEWKTITKIIISVFLIFYFMIYCGMLS